MHELVEKSLRRAALWEEVKDKLHESAYALSGGQQQRLCIARALAVDPEVLLLDEPCSALDPIATSKIEDLLFTLKEQCTIVIVTHNMQQAARVADTTGFFLLGKLIEHDKTDVIFKNPSKERNGRLHHRAVRLNLRRRASFVCTADFSLCVAIYGEPHIETVRRRSAGIEFGSAGDGIAGGPVDPSQRSVPCREERGLRTPGAARRIADRSTGDSDRRPCDQRDCARGSPWQAICASW